MDLAGGRFVLIGGGGFIGAHTAACLAEERPDEILVFGRTASPFDPSIARRAKNLGVRLSAMRGDVLTRDALNAAIAGADGVFHFAAMWMLHCHEAPRDAFDVNIAGTFNVMEACVAADVKRLVFSSSRSVYGSTDRPARESDALLPDNMYGASKVAGEAMLAAYARRYGLSSAALRYFNVYGPGQTYRGPHVGVIHKMLNAIEAGDRPTVMGDGSETFDFVSVKDCAEANVAAMRADAAGPFNVGTGVGTSLGRLAELLIELTGFGGSVDYKPAAHPSAVRMSVADPEQARRELGFSASIGLRDGLERVIAWRHGQRQETGA